MKKYKLLIVNSAATSKMRSFILSKITIGLLVAVPTVLVLGLFSCLIYLSTLKTEISNLYHTEHVYIEEYPVMSATISILTSVVDKLYENDYFVSGIFAAPYVRSYASYDIFTKDFTSARILEDLLNLEDARSYSSIPHLMRYTDLIYSETERREYSYANILEHLEREYILYRHTPSIWPSIPRLTSRFGFRRSPFTDAMSFHEGIDIGALTGTNIYATADGIVVFSGVKSGYGNLVTIDHGFGYMTRYAHNSRNLVKVGDSVKKGDLIAFIGSTGRSVGPHLHYEILYDGTPVNSAKYLPYLP